VIVPENSFKYIVEKATGSKLDVSIILALISRSCDEAGKYNISANRNKKMIRNKIYTTC